MMDQNAKWLRMGDVVRNKFTDGVWIPLWGYVETPGEAKAGTGMGRYDECRIFNTLLVPDENKEEVVKLGVSDLHPMVDRCAVVGSDPYFSARVERNDYGDFLGTYIVVKRCYSGETGEYIISLDQDLILDLRLKQEGDKWYRPCEAYREVIRYVRDNKGNVCLVEIRSEFLRDWLAARRQGLVLVAHIERRFLSNKSNMPSFTKLSRKKTRVGGGIIDYWNYDCDAEGHGSLGDWKVSTMGYDDVHPEDDVPVFDSKSEEGNFISSEKIVKAPQLSKRMTCSRFLRTEWLSPGKQVWRIPFDREGTLKFIATADGRLKSKNSLIYPPRYLWFRNAVLKDIYELRGADVRWLTRETGLVYFNDGPGIHFGINKLGYVNVLAKDIVQQEWWKQEIWKAFNVSPEGGVSEELTDSQQKCSPAKTYAPENLILQGVKEATLAFSVIKPGVPLFRTFENMDEVGRTIQRFNVQSHSDIYWLAKQLTLLLIEALNQDALREVACVSKGEEVKSLKLLERSLATRVTAEEARELTAPFHAIYDLRIADAHLGSRKANAALRKLGITSDGQPIRQGGRMIYVAAKALHQIACAFFCFKNSKKDQEKHANQEVDPK